MKFILAPDSFKESLEAIDVANAIKKGLNENDEVVIIPVSDGGEGFVDVFCDVTKVELEVTSSLGDKIKTYYVAREDRAIIEVAKACGLADVPKDKRNPFLTTSFGVGELIKDAIEKGYKDIIIGLGGSSTNDAGVGMLMALGAKFFDENNQQVGYGNAELDRVKLIELNRDLFKDVNITIASDVQSPLLGESGATYVYSPQKGAKVSDLETLENNITNIVKIISNAKEELPGSGAAGGIGYALLTLFNTKMVSGVDLMLDILDFEHHLQTADYVITGEGSSDLQTAKGKVPVGVSKVAKKHNVPVILISGKLEDDISELYDLGITSYFSILHNFNEPSVAMKNTALNLEVTTRNIRNLL